MYDSDKPDSDIKVVGNNVEQYTMGIEVSSKVFSMNIDGIYQDKYGSTVRELSANALDIHKQCGIIDKPFDIHVPSTFTGKFIIRDYGCGLSKENILKFFGQLFCSSKDKENDSVGFFGIGCKSPFTVTDDFLVVSVHEGVRTEYAFSRENKGTPRCIVLSSKPTDEPSGISIIIDSGETEEWLTAIRNQLIMFPTKPNVYMDGELISVDYPKLTKFGNAFYGTGLPKQVYINQGGVIYPVDPDQFSTIPFRLPVYSKSFVIYTCEIGQITVPPDRERIEITAENIENLNQVVTSSNVGIDDDVWRDFQSNYTDDYKSMHDFIVEHNGLLNVRDIIRGKLEHNIFTNTAIDLTACNQFYTSLYNRITTWDDSYYLKASPSFYGRENGTYKRPRYSSHSIKDIFTSDHVIIVLPYNSTISTAYKLYSNKHRAAYIFRCRKNKMDDVIKVLKDYRDFFGANNTIYEVSSQLAKSTQSNQKAAVKANPIAAQAKKFYKVDINKHLQSYHMTFEPVNDDEIPTKDDDFYLMEVDNSLCYPDKQYQYSTLKDIQQIIYSGLLDKPIYFMKSSHFSNFKYGTKVTYRLLIEALNNSDRYYDLILKGRVSDWGWSTTFTDKHRQVIQERMKKRPNVEVESICKTLNINLSERKHPLDDIFMKIDAFGKFEYSDRMLLKNVSVSSKDVRGLIKNYFVGESS